MGFFMKKINDYSLYLVLSSEYIPSKSPLEVAKKALEGGVDILQMREKDLSYDELLILGKELLALCKESNKLFIVNDDPHLVKAIGADGVHLGQEDLKKYPTELTRSIIGDNKIIGISTHSIDQFKEANKKDFDYIAYGPIFFTKTKPYSIGTDDIEKVIAAASKPVIFIGGINLSNIDELLAKGAKNMALIRAITESDDILNKTKALKSKITNYRGK